MALTVKGVHLEDIPDHYAGQTIFESRTPVLVQRALYGGGIGLATNQGFGWL